MSDPKGNDGDGITALSYILSGVLLYGGLGWLADRWLGTGFLLPAGLILGLALGVYLIIRRFGARP
ncbi:MAG: AtpZ/AtpI family protein [Propionibacteriaceae bacterium]|jgi:F0F1-type ATP synthase assembly protein I|nr:AtpZ/AtpI family protein [Propionibacteriaceae bacterium]